MFSRKHIYIYFFAFMMLMICGVESAVAQTQPVQLPRPSQKASVTQRIGVTDVTITYSRPGVKGRKIWGDPPAGVTVQGEATLDDQNARLKGAPIVPWGHVWRAGANEATTFVISDDALINGQKLPAGSYSLHVIPNKDQWTIVFNSVANQWGSFNYDASKDTLRVNVKPQWMNDNQEWLEYSFPLVTPNSAQAVIRWEKVAVPFTIEIPNVEAVWRGKVDAAIAANPTDWRIPLQVANAYAGDDKWDEALKWADQSIKVKQTFQNLAAKANFLINSGKKEEGLALAEQAIQQGKTDKVDTARFEKRIADIKAGKM